MIVFAAITKFGALFLTIPDPVIGGAFFVLFGMSVFVKLSYIILHTHTVHSEHSKSFHTLLMVCCTETLYTKIMCVIYFGFHD